MKNNQIIAAIDIGSSYIIGALANISAEGEITPLAFSQMPSKGVKKGGIVNIALVQHMIDEVLEQLQKDGRYHIHSIVTSLSGVSIIGYNAEGVVEIRGNAVNEHNVRQAIASARDMATLEGRQLLHILKQHFTLDRMSDIDTPIGLMGERLGARVHIISSAKTTYYNLLQAFSHRDVDVDYVVSSGLASAIAVTSQDEKQLGVCVLDIGGGTTDITVINQGAVKHTEVIPVGGELITADIAFFMRTTVENAEAVKKEISLTQRYAESDRLASSGVSDVAKTYAKADIANVMRERCEQLIEMVTQKLMRAGVEESFPGGFVICGGSANVEGLDSLLMHRTQLPVRQAKVTIALEKGAQSDSRFATIMGLFMCAYEEDYTRVMTDDKKAGIISGLSRSLSSLLGRIRKQF